MPYIIWNISKQQFVESGEKTMVFKSSADADAFLERRTFAAHWDRNGLSGYIDLTHDTFEKVAVQ